MTRATRPSHQRDSSAIDQPTRALLIKRQYRTSSKADMNSVLSCFQKDETVRILYWKMTSRSPARSKKAPVDAPGRRVRRSRRPSGAPKTDPSPTYVVRPLRGRAPPVIVCSLIWPAVLKQLAGEILFPWPAGPILERGSLASKLGWWGGP